MAKRLGDYESNKEIWDTHTVINQIDKIQNGDLAIIFDCGEADFFIQVNKDLHNRLLEKKIDHDFSPVPEDIPENTGITLSIIRFCSLINSSRNKTGKA